MTTLNQVTPIPISTLPAATTLTGNEATAIVQGGQTVQTPISSYPQGMTAGVIVFGSTGGSPFPNYRTLKASGNVGLIDGGPKGDLTVTFTGSGTGTVTTTGSPSSGNLTKFTSGTTITNGDLSGDVTTSGTLVTTVGKINGVTLGSTTATSGNILIGSGASWVTHSVSGDAALSSSGSLIVTKTNGVSFAASATVDATDADNITSGTLAAARLPALTGDVTSSAGSAATTVAKIQGTVVSGTTGTGNIVFSSGPTLTLANATGLPIGSGVSGLATGMATFLGTPSSANLATTLTDKTGSGLTVFSSAPTFGVTITTPSVIVTGTSAPIDGIFRAAIHGVNIAANSATLASFDSTSGNSITAATASAPYVTFNANASGATATSGLSVNPPSAVTISFNGYLSPPLTLTSQTYNGHSVGASSATTGTLTGYNTSSLTIAGSGTANGVSIGTLTVSGGGSANGLKVGSGHITGDSGTNTLTGVNISGVTIDATSNSSTNIYGVQIGARTGSGSAVYSGAVTGVDVGQLNLSGSDAVTNSYGIRIRSQGGALVTNSYGIRIEAQGSSATAYDLYCGGGFFVRGNGNVVVGTSALGTGATVGFPWVPSCSGTPVGAPLAPYTNAAAMVVDTSANKLWVLVGSTWRFVTLT